MFSSRPAAQASLAPRILIVDDMILNTRIQQHKGVREEDQDTTPERGSADADRVVQDDADCKSNDGLRRSPRIKKQEQAALKKAQDKAKAKADSSTQPTSSQRPGGSRIEPELPMDLPGRVVVLHACMLALVRLHAVQRVCVSSAARRYGSKIIVPKFPHIVATFDFVSHAMESKSSSRRGPHSASFD